MRTARNGNVSWVAIARPRPRAARAVLAICRTTALPGFHAREKAANSYAARAPAITAAGSTLQRIPLAQDALLPAFARQQTATESHRRCRESPTAASGQYWPRPRRATDMP